MSDVAKSVATEVSDRISSSGVEVRKRVVDSLVEREVAKRADLLDKSLVKFKELRSNVDKSKPDQLSIAADGTRTETFSKAKWEERQKNQQKVEQLSSAIDNALNNGDFNKLTEVLQKVSQGGNQQSEG